MFSGSHDHVLDDKGRTSLPKEHRQELAKFEGDPWLTALPNCLQILPAEIFERINQRLAEKSELNAAVQRLERLITGMAVHCPVDRQGRILVPAKLREWAGLRREVVFVGLRDRIEVWDRARHQAELERIRESYEESTRELRGSGL